MRPYSADIRDYINGEVADALSAETMANAVLDVISGYDFETMAYDAFRNKVADCVYEYVNKIVSDAASERMYKFLEEVIN